MKLTQSQFRDTLQWLLVDQRLTPEDRRTAIAYTLARGISYTLEVPATPVTNTRMFYLQNHDSVVQGIASQLVEFYAFPVASLTRLVEQFWLMRYQLVHICDYASDSSLAEVAMNSTDLQTLTPKVREIFNVRELAYSAANIAKVLKGA